MQQSADIKHHKNCVIEIIKRLRKVPIKKNIIVRAVVTVSVKDSAASEVISVPIVPAIRFLPCEQIHFFNDEKLLNPARGMRKIKAINDKIDKPNEIHKAMMAFGSKLRVNNTETPIPMIMLKIIAVTPLQEFCLHILIILSFKLGWYLITLYAQNKFLIIYIINIEFLAFSRPILSV